MADDSARYRKMYPRAWKSFRGLSLEEKAIAAYLLTGDQTNRIGLYDFSIGKAIEDLETLPQTFKKGFDRVCQTLGWEYDNVNRVLFIPSWWKWNPPENPNVLIGNLKDLFEVAVSPLYDEFKNNTEHLISVGKGCFDLTETFTQTLAERYPKPYPKQQEQEQEQDKSYAPKKGASLSKNSYPQDFEAAFLAYPKNRRGSKKAAFLQYQKHKPSIPTNLIETIERQKAEKARADSQGIFYPEFPDFERWIKKANWEKEPFEFPGDNGGGQKPKPARSPTCPRCRGSGLYKSGETPDHQPIMSTCDCDKNGPHEPKKTDPALPAAG